MFVVIFGRPGCPYCVRAKTLLKKLKGEVSGISIIAMLILLLKVFSKADLSKICR